MCDSQPRKKHREKSFIFNIFCDCVSSYTRNRHNRSFSNVVCLAFYVTKKKYFLVRVKLTPQMKTAKTTKFSTYKNHIENDSFAFLQEILEQ